MYLLNIPITIFRDQICQITKFEKHWTTQWKVQQLPDPEVNVQYPLLIKHGNGKSPVNGGFDRKRILHCHVWLPEGTSNSPIKWYIHQYPTIHYIYPRLNHYWIIEPLFFLGPAWWVVILKIKPYVEPS